LPFDKNPQWLGHTSPQIYLEQTEQSKKSKKLSMLIH
jgi:hypothetical protein